MTPSTVACGRVALGAACCPRAPRPRSCGVPARPARPLARTSPSPRSSATSLPFTLLAWGEEQITSALTAVLNASTPLFTALARGAVYSATGCGGCRSAGLVVGLVGVGGGRRASARATSPTRRWPARWPRSAPAPATASPSSTCAGTCIDIPPLVAADRSAPRRHHRCCAPFALVTSRHRRASTLDADPRLARSCCSAWSAPASPTSSTTGSSPSWARPRRRWSPTSSRVVAVVVGRRRARRAVRAGGVLAGGSPLIVGGVAAVRRSRGSAGRSGSRRSAEPAGAATQRWMAPTPGGSTTATGTSTASGTRRRPRRGPRCGWRWAASRRLAAPAEPARCGSCAPGERPAARTARRPHPRGRHRPAGRRGRSRPTCPSATTTSRRSTAARAPGSS